MAYIESNREEEIQEAEGSKTLSVAVIVLFAVFEVTYVIDVARLYSHHVLWSHLLSAVCIQIELVVALLSFVLLWRKKYIHRYRQANWNHSAIYLSTGMIAMLAILFSYRDFIEAIYAIKCAG